MVTNITLRHLIKLWVRNNYGASEMVNPSWDINALANYLHDAIAEVEAGNGIVDSEKENQ